MTNDGRRADRQRAADAAGRGERTRALVGDLVELAGRVRCADCGGPSSSPLCPSCSAAVAVLADGADGLLRDLGVIVLEP